MFEHLKTMFEMSVSIFDELDATAPDRQNIPYLEALHRLVLKELEMPVPDPIAVNALLVEIEGLHGQIKQHADDLSKRNSQQ